jgi:hypothetical protein
MSVFLLFLSICLASSEIPCNVDECCICLESDTGENVKTVCGEQHRIHGNCIRNYRQSPASPNPDLCPYCRQEMSAAILSEYPIPRREDDNLSHIIDFLAIMMLLDHDPDQPRDASVDSLLEGLIVLAQERRQERVETSESPAPQGALAQDRAQSIAQAPQVETVEQARRGSLRCIIS